MKSGIVPIYTTAGTDLVGAGRRNGVRKQAYLPRKTGGRFSLKDLMPSA